MHLKIFSVYIVNGFRAFIYFSYFLLNQKVTKNQGFIGFQCFYYVRFLPRHASRSPSNSLPTPCFGAWLTSAWLGIPNAQKPSLKNY